jgi:hypothetical protein
MRIYLLFLIFGLYSCSSSGPQRKIASYEEPKIRKGEIDFLLSKVSIYPAKDMEDDISYYLFLELRNSEGRYVDCDQKDLSIKTKQGKRIDFDFHRALVGRYYLKIEKEEDIKAKHIDLYFKDKSLKEQFKVRLNKPHKSYTKLTLVNNQKYRLTFRLRFADKKNSPIELPEAPEIWIDGQGLIEDVKHLKEGIWEFSIIYPEENQVMYISARAMGVSFRNLYRFQHIEK